MERTHADTEHANSAQRPASAELQDLRKAEAFVMPASIHWRTTLGDRTDNKLVVGKFKLHNKLALFRYRHRLSEKHLQRKLKSFSMRTSFKITAVKVDGRIASVYQPLYRYQLYVNRK